MKAAVIYDFHGTLVDVSGIRDLLAVRDYDGFYEQSLTCPAIETTVEAARKSYKEGFVNLLFTGMPIRYAQGLAGWLDRHQVPIDLTKMRGNRDFRKDYLVKQEMYARAVGQGCHVVRAWEDSPRVVKLWEEQGIPVTVVPGWDENLTVRKVDNSGAPS